MTLETRTIAFIGAGNIASAIIGGLIQHGYPAGNLRAADPDQNQLARLQSGIRTSTVNADVIDGADVIVLCVKPDLAGTVAAGMADVAGGKLLISVAAGITTGILGRSLGASSAVIRCMPNTPALVGCGMTGLFANPAVTAAQRTIAEGILSAVGTFAWFDNERELDMVTAISGSGPAYFLLVMEAMQAAAIELGLTADASRNLVLQTALGAARMALSSTEAPAELRRRVTSPGGTTEAAIRVLLESDLPGSFNNAIRAAFKRSIELAGTQDR
jgi:pyrroline-5-carboxylate reductase